LFVGLLALLFHSSIISAQQVQPLEPEWLRRMYDEGWQKVQEGVLQRNGGEGQIETFSYGAEGLQWAMEDYQRKLVFFEEKYIESPNGDLAALIEQLKGKIESLRTNLVTASSAETFDGEGLNACSMSFDAPVPTAVPERSPRGIATTATAFFNSTQCGYAGSTTALAWAHATEGTVETTKTQTDPKSSNEANGYAGITSYASASAPGSTDCETWAVADVTIEALNINIHNETRSYTCPPDVAASITGPTLVKTDFYTPSCADVTWTANPTGGTPGYTYHWYVDSVDSGTGSTLTKQYCAVNKVVGVRVVVTDQNQWSTEATFSTEIRHTPPVTVSINGLDRVDTNSATPCVDVTWSANAKDGHPGYTYSWYTGTGTVVEGTGSTFVKQYCRTMQLVTARVVARDSDGHTAEATKQTNIVHTPDPLAAAVSGPAQVVTDYYTSTCANVTWTVSASGGYPGYTYKWYLGTDTTVQGTGTSLTKNYCTTNGTVTAKVVVTDSQGATATPTLTTTLEHRNAIVATITGPTSVTTSGCVDVTWTASASSTGGKHSGFTYRWYIGTGTTIQSSTSTLTQRYCSTTTVTVKVVARASDGHTSEATKTSTITPPLATTISGPTDVYLDYYTQCKNVTWTASATGGSSGYTYSWYIGTTVVGSGTSYTKYYCTTNQNVTVKVVAKDSAGTTAQDTHSTTIYYNSDPCQNPNGQSGTDAISPIEPCY